MTILHTVPFLPSAVAVMTLYTPEATRLPFWSRPSQVYVPPLLMPVFTSCPEAVEICMWEFIHSPTMVIRPV